MPPRTMAILGASDIRTLADERARIDGRAASCRHCRCAATGPCGPPRVTAAMGAGGSERRGETMIAASFSMIWITWRELSCGSSAGGVLRNRFFARPRVPGARHQPLAGGVIEAVSISVARREVENERRVRRHRDWGCDQPDAAPSARAQADDAARHRQAPRACVPSSRPAQPSPQRFAELVPWHVEACYPRRFAYDGRGQVAGVKDLLTIRIKTERHGDASAPLKSACRESLVGGCFRSRAATWFRQA